MKKEGEVKLTEQEVGQLLRYAHAVENEPIKGKRFWKRHETIIDKLHGVLFEIRKEKPKEEKNGVS